MIFKSELLRVELQNGLDLLLVDTFGNPDSGGCLLVIEIKRGTHYSGTAEKEVCVVHNYWAYTCSRYGRGRKSQYADYLLQSSTLFHKLRVRDEGLIFGFVRKILCSLKEALSLQPELL